MDSDRLSEWAHVVLPAHRSLSIGGGGSLQYGIIVAGYFAALSVRALDTPVIHHSYHELPRFDVGLALLLLMFVPTSKSWPGAILSLTSCALILNHWFG